MTKNYTILLDIGGTFTRSALLDEKAHIIPNSFSIFTSKLFEPIEVFLNNLVKIIKFNSNSILEPDFKIQNILLSYSPVLIAKHTEQLIDLEYLKQKLFFEPSLSTKLSKTCKYYLIRDAYLFALGEQILRPIENQKTRVLYLNIGSGLTVALTENSELANEKYNWLINKTFNKQSTSCISSEGILKLAFNYGLQEKNINAKEVAELAISGNEAAILAFESFGEKLAYLIEDILHHFSPHEIIIGGNIALSYSLFKYSFERTINNSRVQIKATEFTSHYIFFGMAEVIKNKAL